MQRPSRSIPGGRFLLPLRINQVGSKALQDQQENVAPELCRRFFIDSIDSVEDVGRDVFLGCYLIV